MRDIIDALSKVVGCGVFEKNAFFSDCGVSNVYI